MRTSAERSAAAPRSSTKRGPNVWMWIAMLLAILLILGGIWTVFFTNNGGGGVPGDFGERFGLFRTDKHR